MYAVTRAIRSGPTRQAVIVGALASTSPCPRSPAPTRARAAMPTDRPSLPCTRTLSTTTTTTTTSSTASKVPHQRVLTILDDPAAPNYAARHDFNASPADPRTVVLRTVHQVRAWTAHISRSSSSSSSERTKAEAEEEEEDAGIALIPTMGALHEGHLDLIRAAARAGHAKIVVSIYVNPAQFGVREDLASYPKTWDADCAALARLRPELEAILLQQTQTKAGGKKKEEKEATSPSTRTDTASQQDQDSSPSPSPSPSPPLQLAIFAPTTPEMYPSGFPGQEPDSDGSFVTITPVGAVLEGQTRPTFFRGVATVCLKLFLIVLPARVFFGQKDIQQTVVIRQLVRDFHLPIDVVVSPTTREKKKSKASSEGDIKEGDMEGEGEEGELALSSRNVYLGPRRRAVAPVLVRALRAGEAAYLGTDKDEGARTAREIVPAALAVILQGLEAQSRLPASEGVLFELDYIALRDPDTFAELEQVDPARGAILCGAIKMLPVFEAREGEDLGESGGPPVRLIDNLVLPPIVERS